MSFTYIMHTHRERGRQKEQKGGKIEEVETQRISKKEKGC
jgi:hypothetical protein